MTKFKLQAEYIPKICLECAYYDEETCECLAAESIFGDCALLEALIIPELSPEDLDEMDEDG